MTDDKLKLSNQVCPAKWTSKQFQNTELFEFYLQIESMTKAYYSSPNQNRRTELRTVSRMYQKTFNC